MSERRRFDERQDLLIAELNHRLHNILSLIRGVINQSKDSAETVESFTRIVGGRIDALARAHDQVMPGNARQAAFRDLVATEAAAYHSGDAGRVRVGGAEILLEPEAFVAVALTIHEMMTNSVKYGALSNRDGVIEITTDVGPDGDLTIGWSEQGGPAVTPPTRQGFGSRVIERSIKHDLGGEADVEFATAGVCARFRIPAQYFQETNASGDSAGATGPRIDAGSAPVPRDLLLVEDSVLIALDAEHMLREMGVETVRVASNVAEALDKIGQQTPQFALLDVQLGRDTSIAVAERLMELNVPFAFATGLGEQAALPQAFDRIRKISKLYDQETIRSAITGF